ncbi:Dabb family protein [Agromyces intestinalis]|uniref:Dabb family protein n=1 Tax=Agromyces intestinalis TaxID=2592652 RepID=A0A5C1YK51_9MICO|nr:Dabb family protein [Agromyces intestinalis]QEO15650.1 Dabb family protein [Agromyces intestinalis]
MIQHTVSFRLVSAPGSAEEADFLDTARATLSAIPGVQEFTVSRQISPKSTHTHQFSMVFADAEAYRAYDAHPAHGAFVADRWVPEVAEFQELDLVAIPA